MLTQPGYERLAAKLVREGFRAEDLGPKRAPSHVLHPSMDPTLDMADRIASYLQRQPEGSWVSAKEMAVAIGGKPLSIGVMCRCMPRVRGKQYQGWKLWQWAG